MLERRFAIVAALVLTHVVSASAQQFPGDDAYGPWPCPDTGVMTDPFHDESGATFERDLVGDTAAPTGLRATDPDFLYVRLRVDEDPAPGGIPRPWAWGLLIDTNNDPSIYEVMLAADGGGGGTVSIYLNTSGTPGDARDPPDFPSVSVHPWNERARAVAAPGSSYGGTPDYFVDFAFSWSELAGVGIGPATPVRVWAATSSGSATTGMTGDFACVAGGAPTLSTAWPATAPDPWNVARLAGGGGCHHGTAGIAALAAVLPLLMRARRRLRQLPTKS